MNKMATNITLKSSTSADEEFIDIEIITSRKSREFEFQMNSTHTDKQTTTSTADELFYNGKLLPLHRFATATTFEITKESFETNHFHKRPFTSPCTNTTNTPLDSCNISLSESCRVSCKLSPDEYVFHWSTELTQLRSFIHNHPTKKSKKQKLMQKLKFSKTYLKSLFTKSACSDGSNYFEQAEDLPNKYFKISKNKTFSYPTIATIMKTADSEDSVGQRSFSGAMKRHSPVKCLSNSSSVVSSSSSSSFSFNLNELQFLRRSASDTEIDGSIEAAIAHCKKSQQIICSTV